MFTGLVEETGVVESLQETPAAIRLALRVKLCSRGMKKGDSLAVNGCCLTVVSIRRRKRDAVVAFDLLRETWARTSFAEVAKGSFVNLERSLRPNDRLGGHFVSGHVDATGRIRRWEKQGGDHLLEVSAPKAVMQYVVEKGSIAIDGISLTVAAVGRTWFRIWIIPHTHAVTNLRQRAIGDRVNLEADLIGKYVARFTAAYTKDGCRAASGSR
jgi:riboflavin synthase